MKTMQAKLIEHAKEHGYEIVLATVHPENIASYSVISKDLSVVKTTNFNGYLRHIMRLDI